MYLNNKLLIVILLIVVFAGCKKDEETNQPNQSSNNRYDCVSGDCELASNGYFSSLYECNSVCGDTIVGDTTNTAIEFTEGEGVEFHGYTYSTIVLGNGQEWMSENLGTSKYANGESLIYLPTPGEWSISQGAWCIYDNDGSNHGTYGGLYNWAAVADVRNICPTGWRVPIEADWIALIEYLDANADGNVNDAGGKMKVPGTDFWLGPNVGATNESGFSGFPGGWRLMSGDYINMGTHAMWWTRTNNPDVNNGAWARLLYFNDEVLGKYSYHKQSGLSVRCIKN